MNQSKFLISSVLEGSMLSGHVAVAEYGSSLYQQAMIRLLEKISRFSGHRNS